jgi:alginate O-acetyltransferase complex protein AlgI
MQFNTPQFIIFFLIVYSLYRILPWQIQNYMLLIASYVFYGSWDIIFLGLILVSTVVDYACGFLISQTSTNVKPERKSKLLQKYLLVFSLTINLSILGLFKYFNFFIENFKLLFTSFGWEFNDPTLNLILPVGISFYTFQSMSYSIDVYRGKIKATKNFFDYALFVSFFPQLVAGPIERAASLLPQIQKPREHSFKKNIDGIWLICWGLYKKIYIADNLGLIVDAFYNSPEKYHGPAVLLGAIYAFTFQIYCDFSGYSNVARGLAKLLGFELVRNFKLPFFSEDPSDLWKRWHCSLTSWLRDYVFLPSGGYSIGKIRGSINLIIVMTLVGLWHGANWTFVIWGFYWGIILVAFRVLQPMIGKNLSLSKKIIGGVITFHLLALSAPIFRAENVTESWIIYLSLFSLEENPFQMSALIIRLALYCLPLLILEAFQRAKKDEFVIFTLPAIPRAFVYFYLLYSVLIWGEFGERAYIYFQF